ncbi:hypothetical protein FA95DRAFT_632937 [Auriscalpium vulgare]|uniref:Uncharacterized protein n=1 Tax=Auriscalpium vulgare TaxID=40419 RepID=A0ACB8RD63_9AGAM|nr:hypothetical protein FA95DRAFT_632937 [Auriscalpium vulgare]
MLAPSTPLAGWCASVYLAAHGKVHSLNILFHVTDYFPTRQTVDDVLSAAIQVMHRWPPYAMNASAFLTPHFHPLVALPSSSSILPDLNS